MKSESMSAERVALVRRSLLERYDRAARDLPWRHESDPYRIWVSEVMLQQTRVDTVTPYYERWLEQFPDLASLADAEHDDVMKAWEGLGYYRRARYLHQAVGIVRDQLGGEVPTTVEGLRELPGIGEYTAGAIASIAYGTVSPAVDGNVKRVLARLYDEARPSPAWLRDRASELVHPSRPGDWNQALMEHGATVCTPRSPRCGECPVQAHCRAFAAGTQDARPARARRDPVRAVEISITVFEREGRTLLMRRPAGGLLAGLWAFPEGSPSDVAASLALVIDSAPHALDSVRHRFTHLDATYLPEVVRVVSSEPRTSAPDAKGVESLDTRWVTPGEADELALPIAQQKILSLWKAQRGPAV